MQDLAPGTAIQKPLQELACARENVFATQLAMSVLPSFAPVNLHALQSADLVIQEILA